MASRYTCPLSELNSSHVSEAGGKGASLGELMCAKAPVPPGFVVTSIAFQKFISQGDLKQIIVDTIQTLNAGQIDLAQANQQIHSALEVAAIPDEVIEAINKAQQTLQAGRVSVRSSATCEDSATSAWAGQLETFLDVTPDKIVENVRSCWLSLFSESALSYGATHGYAAGQISVAVVVQKMIASEISGIGFSVHPVTQEPDIQLIEACLGLGEAIVSGRIVPDQFVVARHSNEILESIVGDQKEALWMGSDHSKPKWQDLDGRGTKPKITSQQVIEYSKILARLHDHYGHPIDTEWAIEDGAFQILQARPITTLAKEYDQTLIDESQEWQFLVRRPFFLLAATVLPFWLDSKHADKTLGTHLNETLLIQDDTGLFNLFYAKKSIDAYMEHIGNLLQNERTHLIEILKHALGLYDEGYARIDRGLEGFDSLQEIEDFFADIAQHTTVFPAWVLIYIESNQIDDPEVQALSEKIRSHTFYPVIERRILEPLAIKTAKALGFSKPERACELIVWSELKNGLVTRDLLESRLAAVEAGHRSIFQVIEDQETFHLVSQTGYLLTRLAKQRQLQPVNHSHELTGQVAWPGVFRGRAHVVLSLDAMGQTMEPDEVLVSIQSSPALMPLLERCGAIVTDDGGIACHAAILARELRKPALIGTQLATRKIKTGDLIEVDTYHQVVRILEHDQSS
ncbi:PEP/pyruvate-binding domain-containing protein [Gimesia aquarii]|uniref:Phosphoenolpyruvate synthase n=1 Tax=Gimesia aquarii TaxID=2527964 RepID=A0A517WVH4_9PLAN|nr:PEP/pyruvate-binding domain-containing protein [Gimesia aquarii]QDU09256.1 Phosphoenolpyruvate synthase [Gimesia aquarii]